MLKLIKIELWKMQRRPFLILATLAAIILPIPLSILTAKTGQGYDFLFKSVINIGQFVLLIPVLCIVSIMLFFGERDNNTLKSLLTIPVSPIKLTWAKLIIILMVSVLYSVFSYAATIIGSELSNMAVEQPMQKLLLCMITGIMTWVASLPCIALIIALSKNYILSILVTFLYAVIGFIVTNATLPQAAPNLFMLLPVNTITRWLMPAFQNLNTAKYPFEIASCTVSTLFCIIYMGFYIILFGWLIGKKFARWNR